MKTRWMWLAAMLLFGSLLLAACGGGGDEGGGGGGDEGGGDEGGSTFTINAKEFAFDPATLTIPADQEVTIEIVNGGTIEHDFTIDEANLKIAVPATETGTGTVTLPAGTYTFYCSVPGHQQAGMEGTLTVS